MLDWAFLFLLLALLAGAMNFSGIAGLSLLIAKVLFFAFLVLFVVTLLFGSRKRA